MSPNLFSVSARRAKVIADSISVRTNSAACDQFPHGSVGSVRAPARPLLTVYTRIMPKPALAMALAMLMAGPSHAVELQLYFSALQRILGEQIFTQDGRLYVKGDRKNLCSFAYLEKPVVSADNGRLNVRARFSGRSAQNLFGRCLGMGDSFDVLIGALPQYRDGWLALREVRVDSPGRDGFYVRQVRAAMATSLARTFKYDVASDAKRILEQPRPNSPSRQELRRFDVREIRVLADSIVVVLDFQLSVR